MSDAPFAESDAADSTLDGDGPCAECGGTDNLVWWTDNVLWNRVVRQPDGEVTPRNRYDYAIDRWGREPILCIRCFVAVAEERGYQPLSWRLEPVWPMRRTCPIPPGAGQ